MDPICVGYQVNDNLNADTVFFLWLLVLWASSRIKYLKDPNSKRTMLLNYYWRA